MQKIWAAQLRNRFLWVPILMSMSAGFYFALPFEAHVPFPFLLAAVAFVIAVVRRVPVALRAIAIFLFGFFYACAFTRMVATPVLSHNLHNKDITARVVDIDYTPDKARLFLRVNGSDIGVDADAATVRVSVAREEHTPPVGATITGRVGLFRPAGADAPAAFDYARWAYFNGLTATGYMENISVAGGDTDSGTLRDTIHRRADSFLTDALVLGYKGALSRDARDVWTTVGIAHVWSISGFHITLVSTWLFIVFFTIFRAIPFITRRVPARIPATVCAWVGIAAYLMISGASVATVRAFLMASLVFVALLIGRSALSMRNICLAFCAIFLMNPHYVMQAGFQLSFAAVFGLIWFWRGFKYMPGTRVMKILYAATMTAIVATVFTLPFVAAHFSSLPTYGLIGNLILLPLFSFAIMPVVMLGTATAMFGWHWPLNIAHYIYDFAFRIAGWISELPLASIPAPYMPNTALVLVVIGCAALMFIQPVKRKINVMISAGFILAAVCVVVFAPRPVFYSTADNELVAMRGTDGKLIFNQSRASNHLFTFDTWKQMNGEATGTPNPRAKSDKGLYRFDAENFSVVYVQKYVPLARNIEQICADDGPDYLVSYLRVDAPNCHTKILRGGFVIYPSGRVRYIRHNRIWHTGINSRN